jgi:4-amino-4-deoxy-L-arabinose transferase-like glycosyltransferase
MPLQRPEIFVRLPVWLCNLLAALLILGSAGGHVLFLVADCPLDLAPDEAHYWDWSRHLDWSYYSKGPLVALLIRGSCELFGPLSVHLNGSLMPAIRLPAVVLGTLLLWGLYVLSLQVYRRHGLALFTLLLSLTLPLISAGSSLMTIDAPYCCCWVWAMILAHRAIFSSSAWAWPLAGLLVGLGILAKYTMGLLIPSIGLFLLFTPIYRRLLIRPGFWVMSLIAALCCLPILWWNYQHDWITFKHVERLGDMGKSRILWWGPLVYVGGQCALLLVYWFVCWVWAMVEENPLRQPEPGPRYLWFLSAPMFLWFLLFSLKTGGGELNWPVTAYLSGLVLLAECLEGKLLVAPVWQRRMQWSFLVVACVSGLMLTLVMHRSEVIRPLLARLVGPPTQMNLSPLRKLDPTCRLRGWRTLAAEVDRLRQEFRSKGIEPVLAATNWSLPGELGVYCEGHPQAYSIGLAIDDRHSQYDLWTGPIDHPEAFRGRTFIIIGRAEKQDLLKGFASVEPIRLLNYAEGEHNIAMWGIMIAHGYQGLEARADIQH